MSELINESKKRRELLKHMILQLHEGVAPEQVRGRIAEAIKSIPYGDVVAVEQELIAEGLPEEEVLKLCDIHHQVLDGNIDQEGAKAAPPGHPVDTFVKENQAIKDVCDKVNGVLDALSPDGDAESARNTLLAHLNSLMDVDKHYRRKENLLFPYLEKNDVTGPPKVMWGKHDEIRQMLKGSLAALKEADTTDELSGIADLTIRPVIEAIVGMTLKEEQILFPMTMDILTEADWYSIYQQTIEIGYCLVDPMDTWAPEGIDTGESPEPVDGTIRLPSGSFTLAELEVLLNTLSIDITFVDATDKVKYFSQGKERIFDRNRAILGRDVRMCHPPSSVHVVDQIVDDFRSGRQDSAVFWIQMGPKFVHIAYYAMRDKQGDYLGTVEVSQEISGLRALEGEQRILSYAERGD
jgi:hypothetical protein